MKLSIELYSEKPLFVKDESYVEMSIRSHGFIIPDSRGTDHFSNSFTALSGSRIAGIGRNYLYTTKDRPLGLGKTEARPGTFLELEEEHLDDLHLIFETNILLDPGTIRDSFGIRIVNKKGKNYDIPLARPDIEIYWNARGRFVITLTEFINSKLLLEV